MRGQEWGEALGVQAMGALTFFRRAGSAAQSLSLYMLKTCTVFKCGFSKDSFIL